MKQVKLSFLSLVSLIGLSVTISTLVFTANKGLDLSDESFYFIGYHFNIEPVTTISFFHKIYNNLFGVDNIIFARLIRVVLTFSSAFLLGCALAKKFTLINKIEVALFISFCATLSFAFYPYSISYNSFALIFLNLIISIEFLKKSRINFFLILFQGMLITSLILDKFSSITSVILFFSINHFFLNDTKKNLLYFSKLYLIYLLSIVTTFLFYFHSFENISTSFSLFVKGISIVKEYSFFTTFTSIYYGMIHLISFSKFYLLSILLVGFIFRYFKLHKYQSLFIVLFFLIYSFLIIQISIITKPVSFFLPYFVLIALSISTLYLFSISISKKSIILGITFFLLTFTLSLGTNNSLFIHFIFNGNLLGICLYLIIKDQPFLFKRLSVFFFIVTIIIQFSNNVILNPYRYNSSVFKQNIDLSNSNIGEIKIDKKLETLNKEIAFLNNSPCKYVFLMSDQLGISLLIDKQPFPFYWFVDKNLNTLKHILKVSPKINTQDLIFVIPKNKEIFTTVNDAFKTIDIDLINKYNEIKTIEYNKTQLVIYCPKI